METAASTIGASKCPARRGPCAATRRISTARNRYTGQNYEERGRTFNALRGQITRILPGKKAEVIGSLGNPKELESFIKKDDWNSYHLIVRGNTLIHILNGHVMSMVIDDDTENRRLTACSACRCT